jgi:hypothetical protein
MKISQLKRDPDYIKKHLVETKDGKLVVLKDSTIIVPARFLNKGLSIKKEQVYIIGMYALIMGDRYAVSNVNAMININPIRTTIIKINDVDHYEFAFNNGSVMIKDLNTIRDDNIIYNIFDEFISNGNVPWYFDYEDMGRIFATAKEYADMRIGDNTEVIQLLVSVLSRDNSERLKYYRHNLKKYSDLEVRPTFVPLESVMYVATNTLNKLTGSYFSEGVMSALVNPSEKVERLEELLRA